MSKHQLSVRLCGVPVGALELFGGSMRFSYLENTERALSLSMPIRSTRYTNKSCEVFFGGLLPEKQSARKFIARLYGINSESNFSLLEKIGFDCAGAVSLVSPEEPVDDTKSRTVRGMPISDEQLRQHLIELPIRPLFIGIDGIRISLAGAQDKAALCLINDELCIPAPQVPSTHIIKPAIKALPLSVENEYFCMRLAKKIGLTVCDVQIRKAIDMKYLLISRYDRIVNDSGEIHRIHQEDFCQALGIVSTKKYQADGGPNLIDCLNLVEKLSRPAKNKIEMIKRIIFNVLVGNADAHAKNFSVLHLEDGSCELTPAYDILSTVIYGGTTTNLAMSIGSESVIDDLKPVNWMKF